MSIAPRIATHCAVFDVSLLNTHYG